MGNFRQYKKPEVDGVEIISSTGRKDWSNDDYVEYDLSIYEENNYTESNFSELNDYFEIPGGSRNINLLVGDGDDHINLGSKVEYFTRPNDGLYLDSSNGSDYINIRGISGRTWESWGHLGRAFGVTKEVDGVAVKNSRLLFGDGDDYITVSSAYKNIDEVFISLGEGNDNLSLFLDHVPSHGTNAKQVRFMLGMVTMLSMLLLMPLTVMVRLSF